jgi:hypothetical protein
MATPLFAFRLPAEQAASVREMAKVFGAKDGSDFCRQMLAAMCSGQPEQIKAFVGRLIQRAGEQLTLQLTAPMDAVVKAQKPVKKAKKKAKGKKGGRRGTSTS